MAQGVLDAEEAVAGVPAIAGLVAGAVDRRAEGPVPVYWSVVK